jgi:hypothetical protein
MKKKGTLVKRLFIYVFSLCMLSLYTTSCVSYDEDIDDIYKRLEELQSQIDDIKKQIDEGNYVVSVEQIPNGIRVTFKRGGSYDIVSGTNGTNGAEGTPGTRWEIGVDSLWHLNGDPNPFTQDGKTFRAIGQAGQDGKQGENSPSPIIYEENDMYYWIVFEWDADVNAFVPDTARDKPLKGYNTYVVDRGTYYELNVWVQDLTTPENGKYEKIDLPKYVDSSTPFLEFLGYYEHFNIKTPGNPISMQRITDDIEFRYWYLPEIYNKTDGGYTSLWVGQKTVRSRQVLTTLENDSAVAIIRTNLPKGSWKLTLKDSHDGLLPITFGSPVTHTGLLTKALGNDSIYILQMTGEERPFDNIGKYSELFKTSDGSPSSGVVYSLIDTVTGINSGYKAFITARPGDNRPPATLLTIDGNAGIDNGTDSEKEYEVSRGIDIKIRYDDPYKFLYDYYVEAVDPTLADKFGFAPNKTNGTFSVTRTDPDEEKFKLVIYRLHYNGDFYKDTVLIKPLP